MNTLSKGLRTGLLLVWLGICGATLAGCEDGPFEEAGEEIDEAGEDLNENLDDLDDGRH